MYYLYKNNKFVAYTSIKNYAKLYKKENKDIRIMKSDEIDVEIDAKYELVEFQGFIMSIEEFDYLDRTFFAFLDTMCSSFERLITLITYLKFDNAEEDALIAKFVKFLRDLNTENNYHRYDDMLNQRKIIKHMKKRLIFIDDKED